MSYVLILGAKSDIARACAHKFAKEGYNLYLAGRNHKSLEADVSDISIRYKVDVKSVEFDARNFKSHAKFVESFKELPEVVICAFGYLGDQEKAMLDVEEMLSITEANYTGAVSVLNALSESFEDRGSGCIIGISSVAGDRGRKSNYIYGSAKAGFSAYLSGLRNRMFECNVHVLTVKPGFVATKMTEGMDLPAKLTAQPSAVAEDIYRAYIKKKDVLYTKSIWRPVMFIIKHIPEGIFKRLSI